MSLSGPIPPETTRPEDVAHLRGAPRILGGLRGRGGRRRTSGRHAARAARERGCGEDRRDDGLDCGPVPGDNIDDDVQLDDDRLRVVDDDVDVGHHHDGRRAEADDYDDTAAPSSSGGETAGG